MIFIDSSIPNTMKNEFFLAKKLLDGSGISVLDAARLIKNILDTKSSDTLSDILFCTKVIDCGKRCVRNSETNFEAGFKTYLETKKHLRKESLRDIEYLGGRLLRTIPELPRRNFSEISAADCEAWILATFTTPQQFNKARAMLHGLFEFAVRRDWCDCNPIKRVEKKKVLEKEILPLKLAQIKKIVETAQKEGDCGSLAAAAMLVYAGIRPREVRRLEWRDIDLEEGSITVRSVCSKTGGVRQVEITPALKRILEKCCSGGTELICAKDWEKQWRKIRDTAGFRGKWVQDVLRHTYASFHAKRYCDLPRLQLNMGHADQSLLRARYINMRGISKSDALRFFN